MSVSELELVEQWKAGSAVAATSLTRAYYASVRRFFDLRASAAADDLTQQTFLALAEARASFRGGSSFKTFVFAIARKQLLQHLRDKQVGPRARRYATEGGPGTSLSMVAVRVQEHQFLLMALSLLPVDYQLVVELHYWEDMPLAEMGEVLELNPSTVGSRLAKARELLRENVASITRPGLLRDRLLGDLEGWSRALGPVTAAANARDQA